MVHNREGGEGIFSLLPVFFLLQLLRSSFEILQTHWPVVEEMNDNEEKVRREEKRREEKRREEKRREKNQSVSFIQFSDNDAS
jgi:hypothetical protein